MKNLRQIALLGAICGDIIGSTYEFHPTKSPDFPLLPLGSTFTDDTLMTCAVAEWLMTEGDLTKTLQEWGQRHGDIGYGPSFIKWLWADNPKPYNSYGNGAAMRSSAVGWYARTLEECLELARQTAIVSHNHPEGIKGSQAVAMAVFMARAGSHKNQIKRIIAEKFDYDLSRTVSEIREVYSFDVSCQGSVPESIICFLESEDYESAVRLAVSLGGDTDTMACITGAIAGAYYREIPDYIVNHCLSLFSPDIIDTITAFKNLLDKRNIKLPEKPDLAYELHEEEMEMAEYTILQPKHTGLPIFIYIDESTSYKRWSHPLWVIISNDSPYNSWIALSLSSQHSIISYTINQDDYIDEDTIEQCKKFISLFKEVLTDIANEVVDSEVMFHLIKKEPKWWTLSTERVHEIYENFKDDYMIPEDAKSFKEKL